MVNFPPLRVDLLLQNSRMVRGEVFVAFKNMQRLRRDNFGKIRIFFRKLEACY